LPPPPAPRTLFARCSHAVPRHSRPSAVPDPTPPCAATPLWSPSPERIARSNLAAFARRYAPEAADYGALHRWSLEEPEAFWSAVWEFTGACPALGPSEHLPIPSAFRPAPRDAGEAGPRLNFAENLLRHRDEQPAIVFWNERGRQRELSYVALYREVARVAAALEALGVRPGDRVAGWLPNLPETVIAMLASAAIGAIWSSCSPDFGTNAVVERLGQITPRVLFAADSYLYAGREIDCTERLAEIARAIPSLVRVVVVPYLRAAPDLSRVSNAVLWDEFTHSEAGAISFRQLPFDHPLYVLYSSGTTGLPKGIVHGAGGTLVQHLKELVLHTDLRREDCIFYYTTCGWMMWNWLVSALAVGATLVLWDGGPMAPTPDALWAMAEAEGVSVFGTSAKYLALLEKEGIAPGERYDFRALRTILSTGSPLAPHSFDYVYERIKRDVHLASISGGTDIVSCFVLGVPTLPVWRGEIQAPGLGMAVEVWDEAGGRVIGEPGELVCTRPFPSMPVGFWNDPTGERYSAAYFEHFPGVWRHGDWVEETERRGFVIYGRSDATLNPGGVRIGTAEIYRQVEQVEEVVESVAIAEELGDDAGDVRIALFVRLRPGFTLDDALREKIRRRIREHTSPHHVPKRITQVPDIPRTISGKISEIAVREVVHGRSVKNTAALANPEALGWFEGRIQDSGFRGERPNGA